MPQSGNQEWTQVKPKRKAFRSSTWPETNNEPNTPVSADRARLRNPPSHWIKPADIKADFSTKMKTWQMSSCRRMTVATLDRIQPDGGWDISNAVCVGVGSFSRESVEGRRRSMWQFVVFADLVSYLQRTNTADRNVDMWLQDPMLTKTDASFLGTVGAGLLRVETQAAEGKHQSGGMFGLGPAAELLTKESFFYEPFMDTTEEMARQLVDANVGLYIGSSMRGLMARGGAVGDLAKRFNREYDAYQFPRFVEDPNVLEGMVIQWKPEREEQLNEL